MKATAENFAKLRWSRKKKTWYASYGKRFVVDGPCSFCGKGFLKMYRKQGATGGSGIFCDKECERSYYDLTGREFGRLTVVKDTGKRTKNRSKIYLCKCSCEKDRYCEIPYGNLIFAETKSCGCLQKEVSSLMGNNLMGQKFGKGMVIEKTDKRACGGNIIWKLKCDCEEGNIYEAHAGQLVSGRKKSCGCLRNNSYNPEACKIIDEYGAKHGYNFRHAENHPKGEKWVMGKYLIDGYDKEKNVVLEVDEDYSGHHFKGRGINKRLCEKDKIRQNDIMKALKCKRFIRISIDRNFQIRDVRIFKKPFILNTKESQTGVYQMI